VRDTEQEEEQSNTIHRTRLGERRSSSSSNHRLLSTRREYRGIIKLKTIKIAGKDMDGDGRPRRIVKEKIIEG
jgi:hypothetical protein